MVSDCLSYLYEGSTLCYLFHHETVDFFSAVEGCKSKATFLAPLLNRQHQVDIGGMYTFNICWATLTTFEFVQFKEKCVLVNADKLQKPLST